MFEYFREAEEVTIWIADMGVIAASEDYGQDLEHVEVRVFTHLIALQVKFCFWKSLKFFWLAITEVEMCFVLKSRGIP